MEKSSFCKYGKTQVVAFFMLWSAPQQVPAPPFFLFLFYFLLSFSLFLFFSLWREKGGRRGTQRRFEHRHSVYIYQNFFAFDRAIAIKMCSCNHCGLGCLLLFFLSPQLFNFSSNRRALKSPEDKTSSVHVPEDVSTSWKKSLQSSENMFFLCFKERVISSAGWEMFLIKILSKHNWLCALTSANSFQNTEICFNNLKTG